MQKQEFIDGYVNRATKLIGDVARVWAEEAAEVAYLSWDGHRAPEECAEEDIHVRSDYA